MRALLLLAALPLTAGACATPPDKVFEEVAVSKRVQLNEPFRLQHLAWAEIGDEDVEVRFDSVTDDSRCPADVNCMWEGEATAHFTLVEAGRAPVPFALTMEGMVRQVQDIERYQFEQVDRFSVALLLLEPYPNTSVPSDEPPTATLEVRRTMR